MQDLDVRLLTFARILVRERILPEAVFAGRESRSGEMEFTIIAGPNIRLTMIEAMRKSIDSLEKKLQGTSGQGDQSEQ